jgi:hypothetical protein
LHNSIDRNKPASSFGEKLSEAESKEHRAKTLELIALSSMRFEVVTSLYLLDALCAPPHYVFSLIKRFEPYATEGIG